MCCEKSCRHCEESLDSMSSGIKTVSLDSVLKKLQESGFYWGSITSVKAKSLLRDEPVGKFLVRDSSDSRHLFTITLVTSTGITNVRIVFCEGLFSLDKNDTFVRQENENSENRSAPRFDCVVKMVFYYMLLSRKILQDKEQGAAATQPTHGSGEIGTAAVFVLCSPLYKDVSSLQHLCRRALNRQLIAAAAKDLSVPHPVKFYLTQYPYPM